MWKHSREIKQCGKVIITIVIVAFIIIIIESTRNNSSNELFVEAFQESNFNLISVETNVWGEYEKGYISIEEIKTIVNNLAQDIGLKDIEVKKEVNSKLEKVYYVEKKGAYSTTKIKFVEKIEQLKENSYKAKNFVLININLTNHHEDIKYYNDLVKNIMSDYKIETKDTLTLIGEREGKYTKEESKDFIKGIVKKLRCKTQDEYTLPDRLNYYGYSKQIGNYILSDNKKINVDLAVTYDEVNNKTYLYGAVPVITIDY
jgi:polyhydroxyalkanoate synthesis regulator phasin